MKHVQCLMKWVISLIIILLSNFVAAVGVSPLPGDQAFVFSTHLNTANQWIAEWQIAPHYYLYRDRVHLTILSDDVDQKIKISLPPSETKQDGIRGPYQAYSGSLQIPLPLHTISADKVQLRVDYQGCSEAGFCYPPMHKEVTLMLTVASSSTDSFDNFSSFLTNQHRVQVLLQEHPELSLLFFVGLGILLALTPCVLPMVPILASIIMGQKQSLNVRKGFLLALTYVLGMALTYAAIGWAAAVLGKSIQVWLQQPWVISMVSGLFVFLALSLFGVYELQLPRSLGNKLHTWHNKQTGGHYVGVFIMGVLSTLIVSPCVTAPLVGVLLYIGQTGDVLFGASALFMMGLGMGLPLLLIGFSAGKWLPKRGPWMEAMKKGLGMMMLAMAIWLFSRIISESATLFLWGVFLLMTSLFFGLFLPRLIGRARLHQGIGFFVGLFGMVLILAVTVAPELINAKESTVSTKTKIASFIPVKDQVQLDYELAKAKASHQPVFLDFYADWCEACVVMDKKVFSVQEVQQVLSQYVLLRIDLSENTAHDDAFMRRFRVVGPPTMIFFNEQGKELTSHRLVGGINSAGFLEHLADLPKQVNRVKK